MNVEDDYLHGAFWELGEDYFYPLNEKKYSNRSRVNFFEFHEFKNGIPDKVIITIRKDKMTANRIQLDMKFLESSLPAYAGSYYSDIFGTVYHFQVEDGQPVMNHRRYGDMRLQPIDADEFFFILGFVKFKRNQNGEITGLTKIVPKRIVT